MIVVSPKSLDFYANTSISLAVSGVGDMQASRVFQPDTLSLGYRYESEHGAWALDSWQVSGDVRLKSGKLSRKLRNARRGWGVNPADSAPDWVIKTAEWYKPIGVVTYRTADESWTSDD